jgi:dTDP-4-amino-4,6-dideoxygalactose transaminase
MTTFDTTTRLAIHGGTPVRTRPFAGNCSIGGRERELLLDALDSLVWSGFRAGAQHHEARALCEVPSAEAVKFAEGEALFLGGRYVRQLEAMFAARAGVRYAVACNSATSGLVMAAGALDLGPGDEVLVPCMSFHASATAFLPWGSDSVFVEVKPDTFCIDPVDAAAKITPRTRAIVAVHLGGSPADLDSLQILAREHNLRIIEDCAQSPGARHHGREVGGITDVGVYSLTETKSITCGEGGVLVTDDPYIARKARLIRNHGEGAARDDWSDADLKNIVGMNFRLTELQAAVAVAQLEQLDDRNAVRADNHRYLATHLARFGCFIPQAVEPDATPAWFMLKTRYLPARGQTPRNDLAAMLAAEGIPTVPGYPRLLHQNPLFSRRAPRFGVCPRSEALNRDFLWFSLIHPPNTRQDMDDVVTAVEKILGLGSLGLGSDPATENA